MRARTAGTLVSCAGNLDHISAKEYTPVIVIVDKLTQEHYQLTVAEKTWQSPSPNLHHSSGSGVGLEGRLGRVANLDFRWRV